MPRSIWKGVITFGMVSIPVRLFPATQDKDVSFHLLHQPDHSRIKFKRWCEVEDREVEQDELVRAFEVSQGQYVEITDQDLEQLPLPARHTIELSAFVSSAEIFSTSSGLMPRSSMSCAVLGTASGSDTPQSELESMKMRSEP